MPFNALSIACCWVVPRKERARHDRRGLQQDAPHPADHYMYLQNCLLLSSACTRVSLV
ncbi:hypothetical protein B0O80DRAFT_436346 [Mortierella sp. GBAus27b]|nr:hypothetical protein B0O80DRAFT_436346 [Mortierella sp. GBAus27b]